MAALKRLFASRGGATGIEYALIASLISIAIIGGVSLTGNRVLNIYDDVATRVAGATED